MALQLPGAALFHIILAIVLLGVFFAIFVPKSQAQGQNILNLPFFGSDAGGESGSFDYGYKALHVKIRPFKAGVISNDPLQIYEFHLTNQGALGVMHYSDKGIDPGVTDVSQYFDIKNWKDNKCALFTTKVTPPSILPGKIDPFDNNYIYYIDSGTIISSDTTKNPDLKSAIDGRYERGCEAIKCSDFNTGDYTICANECWDSWIGGICKKYDFKCDESASDSVISQPFGSGTDFCNFDTTGCPSTGCCSLLRTSPTENYRLVGGLMCGYSESDIASAKWWVCSPKNNGMSVYTNVKGGANAVQYKCNNGEWVSAADQGISLENPEIKYDSSVTYDDYTVINFYLANHNTAPIKDVSIKATIDASAADCSTFDCTELDMDKSKDGGWAELTSGKTFSSDGLKCPGKFIDGKQFCYKAKKFSVEIKYQYPAGTDKTDKFEISCNPTSTDANGVWQKNVCVATAVSSAQTADCTGGTYACRSQSICTGSNIGGTVDNTKKCTIKDTVCCTK